jgi:hypothetical protein
MESRPLRTVFILAALSTALLGCSPNDDEARPGALMDDGTTGTEPDAVAEAETDATAEAEPEAQPPAPPRAFASGWIEVQGERGDVEHAVALEVMGCADRPAMFAILSDRVVDLASVIEPLAPLDEISSRVALTFARERAGTFAAIREYAGGYFLEAYHFGPNGIANFSGHGVHLGLAPEVLEVGADSVQGRWRGTTEQGAFTGEGAFDFEFTAPLSAIWLGGEALPDGGGSPGAALLADMQQREPERAAGLTVTGGRADDRRAALAWQHADGEKGHAYLTLGNAGGDWQVARNVPCVDPADFSGG